MKRIILNLAVLLLVVASCDKRDEEIGKIDCNVEISTNPDWATEDFKNDYTVQFPDNYGGTGMTGFEGNVFQKRRTDDKVLFIYGYCSETFCEDFGDALAVPAPNSLIVKDKNGNDVVLDSKKGYCVDGEIEGVFYYNTENDAVGKYFMKQGSEFLEGLTVYFPYTDYQEVESIIKTVAEN